MKKNIVFDLGNVLVRFNPGYCLMKRYSREQAEHLQEIIFRSSEWLELDRGTCTQQEAEEILCRRYPQSQEMIWDVFSWWLEILVPISETIDILKDLKKQGFELYYLSNMSQVGKRYILNLEMSHLFTGGIFSCDILSIKPEAVIYQSLLDQYAIRPQDCIFVDDMEVNIRAGEIFGMEGIQFTCAADLRQELRDRFGIST